jgi:hypothetical protein
LRFGARYEYLKYNNSIETYNFNSVSKSYDQFNQLLTNKLRRKNNQATANAGIEFRRKNLTITPGLRWQSQHIVNDISNLLLPVNQNSSNLLPTFSLVYKTLQFYYDRNVFLPGYNYLIAVADNSNPYYITLGNSDLVPSVRDQFSLSYRKNDLKKQFTYGFNSNIGFTKKDIIPFITADAQGVFTNKPVNQDGSRNSFIAFYLNKQFKKSNKFNLSLNHNVSFNNSRSRLLYNNESSWQNINNLGTRAGFYLNLKDKFEWTSNYSLSYYFTRYSTQAFKNIYQLFHTFENEWILRYPKHIIWETNMQYYIDPVTAPGFNSRPLIWNAAINLTMMKKEKGVLKFEVNDLFKTYKHVIRNIQRNSVSTSSNNVLGRYFLLSFTYNIQTIGEKKKVGGWRSALF